MTLMRFTSYTFCSAYNYNFELHQIHEVQHQCITNYTYIINKCMHHCSYALHNLHFFHSSFSHPHATFMNKSVYPTTKLSSFLLQYLFQLQQISKNLHTGFAKCLAKTVLKLQKLTYLSLAI